MAPCLFDHLKRTELVSKIISTFKMASNNFNIRGLSDEQVLEARV